MFFATEDQAHHPFLSAMSGAGWHVWTSVHLTLRCPWFLVTYPVSLDGLTFQETKLVGTVSQLLMIVKQVRAGIRNATGKVSVQLVYVPFESGNDCWKIAMVQRILAIESDEGHHTGHVYDFTDGSRYIDSPENPRLSDSSHQKLIVDFTT
jgi:hypothetical protein